MIFSKKKEWWRKAPPFFFWLYRCFGEVKYDKGSMLLMTGVSDVETTEAKTIGHRAFQPFKLKHLPETPIEPFFFGFIQQLFFGKSPTGSRFAEKGN